MYSNFVGLYLVISISGENVVLTKQLCQCFTGLRLFVDM